MSPIAFDAGSVESTLTLDRTPFHQGLAAARAEARAFEKDPIQVPVSTKGAAKATAQLGAVGKAADAVDKDDVTVEVKTRGAQAAAAQMGGLRSSLLGTTLAAKGMNTALLGMVGLIPTLGPLATVAAGAIGGIGSALVAAGAGAAAFGLVAIPMMSRVTKAMEEGRKAVAKLPPNLRRVAGAVRGLQGAFRGLQARTSGVVSRTLVAGMRTLTSLLRTLDPLVRAAARAFTNLANQANRFFQSKQWQRFVAFLSTQVGPSIRKLGRALGFAVVGVMNLVRAFAPLGQGLLDGLVNAMRRFAHWTAQVGQSKGFQRFLFLVRRDGPLVLSTLYQVGRAVFNVVAALYPLGRQILIIVRAVARWVADNATLVATLAVLFVAIRVGIGVVKTIITVFKAVRAILVVLRASFIATWLAALGPVGIIIAVLGVLVGVFVLLWRRSETFRRIVTAVFHAVKGAVMTAIHAIGRAAVWLWRHAIKPAFQGIAAVGRWLWNHVLKPIFNAVRLGIRVLVTVFRVWWTVWSTIIRALATVFRAFWHLVLEPVVQAIAAGFRWLWNHVLKPVFGLIVAGVKFVGRYYLWLWRHIVSPVVKAIAAAARWLWRNVLKPVFGLLVQGLRFVGRGFRWLWDHVVKPVFKAIGAAIRAAWRHVIAPVFRAVVKGVRYVARGFRAGRDAIRRAWNQLKAIAAKPVEFVVNTVYNKWIRPMWNKVVDQFGVGKGLRLPRFTVNFGGGGGGKGSNKLIGEGFHGGLAHGGALTPAQRAGRVNRPTAVVGEGSRRYPEYVIPTDPRHRSRATLLHQAAGAQLMESGGILGRIGNMFGNLTSWFLNPVKTLKKWFNRMVDLDAIGGVIGGESGWVEVLKNIPKRILKMLLEKVQTLFGGFGAGLRFARREEGKPYVWGGVGPRGYDCSGFLSAVTNVIQGKAPHKRRFTTHSFAPGNGTAGFKSGLASPFQVGVTNSGVGHMAGTLLGRNVESSGGAGVRVGGGARGAGNGLFNMRFGLNPKTARTGLGFLLGGEGGSVAKWIRAAMGITGVPGSWFRALVGLAQHESGGNPMAVNRWDANAARGIASRGLFQTIPPTFRAYNLPGLGGIFNPVANTVAAIRYIRSRYGSIFDIPSYRGGGRFVGGYERGTSEVLRTGLANIHKGEMVVPNPWAELLRRSLAATGETRPLVGQLTVPARDGASAEEITGAVMHHLRVVRRGGR